MDVSKDLLDGKDAPLPAEELLPLVYNELRELAAAKLAREPQGQSLQPTALVHEAYLRLVAKRSQEWDSESHFFAAAAESMRRILVERARRRLRSKYGGGWEKIPLNEEELQIENRSRRVIAVSEALEHFESECPRNAAVVKLRFFAGMSTEETASLLGISRATAARDWAYAKAWLYRQLADSGEC